MTKQGGDYDTELTKFLYYSDEYLALVREAMDIVTESFLSAGWVNQTPRWYGDITRPDEFPGLVGHTVLDPPTEFTPTGWAHTPLPREVRYYMPKEKR